MFSGKTRVKIVMGAIICCYVIICIMVGCLINKRLQKENVQQQLMMPLLKFCKSTVVVDNRYINLEDNTVIFDCGNYNKSVYQINYKTLEIETIVKGE